VLLLLFLLTHLWSLVAVAVQLEEAVPEVQEVLLTYR
jgi:hypothetical protein